MKSLCSRVAKVTFLIILLTGCNMPQGGNPVNRHWIIGNQGGSHPGCNDPECITNTRHYPFCNNHCTTGKHPDDFIKPQCDH